MVAGRPGQIAPKSLEQQNLGIEAVCTGVPTVYEESFVVFRIEAGVDGARPLPAGHTVCR
jgi:hypothetical protein